VPLAPPPPIGLTWIVAPPSTVISYPSYPAEAKESPNANAPLSLILTEFHFLLLNRKRLFAVNRLSEEIVYDQPFPSVRQLDDPHPPHDANNADHLLITTPPHTHPIGLRHDARLVPGRPPRNRMDVVRSLRL
jgi:hypothetical protein